MVAVCDLAESLHLLYMIAAGSLWLLMQAHGIVPIKSGICGIPRVHILRLTEFIVIAFCEVTDTKQLLFCHGWGNIKVSDEWVRRKKLPRALK